MTSLGLFPLLGPGPAEVGALAVPVTPMPAATRCEVVDEFFRSGGGSSVLLTDPQRPDLLGLVSRGRFLQLMSGPFGFGHALFARAPVGQVALWEPVVLDAGASVQQAAVAVLQREGDARYEELVVEFGDHRWGTLSAAAVLEALSRALAEQAMFDGLTGLANRELLLSELTGALDGSGASSGAGGRVVVLFIDLDRFKQVNDVHGHNAGDVLLRVVADRLRAAARPGDVVARLGGDEFAVLLRVDSPPGVEPAWVAGWVARRVLDALSVPVPVVGVNLLVGASIGVAVSAATGSDPQTLLREADLAMYEAKRAGGNRTHTVASVGTQLAALPGLAIDDTLSRALHDGEFVLHYQPIRDLSSGQVVSAEALIRWQHPQRGLRPPGEFLPAAQASGLIVEIDRWVLEQACRQLVRWDHDPGVTAPAWVNVNLSAPHLAHPDLVEHVRQALSVSGLCAGRLRLELPETATLADLRAAGPALSALRAAGVKLTLDDLGAGSSTLRHLSELPVDGVKIDAGFIDGLLVNDRDHAVVRLLIDLAHNLKVNVTAEGIETPEQQRVLVELGCTYGQGYHLGRPHPAEHQSTHTWLASTRHQPAGAAGA